MNSLYELKNWAGGPTSMSSWTSPGWLWRGATHGEPIVIGDTDAAVAVALHWAGRILLGLGGGGAENMRAY